MKIEIIKCESIHVWYYHHIGKQFDVLEIDKENKRYITHKGRIIEAFVKFEDCKIIDEN